MIFWTALLLPVQAFAGIDAPGSASFYWDASEEEVYSGFPGIPEGETRDEARAYFSSDASSFGSDAALIWAGIDLESDDGHRYGMLLMDLDLTRAPLNGNPMPHNAIKAEYIEKKGDQVVFAGEVMQGDVWIRDVLFNEDDEGAVEGDFEMIFADPTGQYPGCRVFMSGRFVTRPSPAGLRTQYGIVNEEPGVYTDVSCGGDIYVTNEGCDCGGDDPGAGGCDGDTSGGSGGCEGDSGGGGCEGDTGSGCGGSGGGGCDGGGGGGGCSGGGGGGCSGGGGGGACAAAHASVSPSHRRGWPLRGLMRMFPWACGILFVVLMKRKYRRDR